MVALGPGQCEAAQAQGHAEQSGVWGNVSWVLETDPGGNGWKEPLLGGGPRGTARALPLPRLMGLGVSGRPLQTQDADAVVPSAASAGPSPSAEALRSEEHESPQTV